MKLQPKRNRSIKVLSFVLGSLISGMILIEGFSGQSKALASSPKDEYDSLKNDIEYHKTLITNSYLLGVSIFKLKESLD
ncbi:MAG: hypothetical protein AAFY41_00060 [Bacteroidota bacterium]